MSQIEAGTVVQGSPKNVYEKYQNQFGWKSIDECRNEICDRFPFQKRDTLNLDVAFCSYLMVFPVTKENYGIEFFPCSNVNKHQNKKWKNEFSNDGNTIEERFVGHVPPFQYNDIREYLENTLEKLVFAQNNIGEYYFCGVYKVERFESDKNMRIYTRINKNYPVQ